MIIPPNSFRHARELLKNYAVRIISEDELNRILKESRTNIPPSDDFPTADFSRADLSGVNIPRADLSGADLSGVNFPRLKPIWRL